MRKGRILRLVGVATIVKEKPLSYGELVRITGLSRSQVDSDVRELAKVGVVDLGGKNFTRVVGKRLLTQGDIEKMMEKKEKKEFGPFPSWDEDEGEGGDIMGIPLLIGGLRNG